MITDNEKAKQKVVDNVLLRLGGGMIDIELTNEQLLKCVDLSLARLRQQSDAFVEESLVIMALTINQHEYILPDEIVDIECIYRKGYGRGYGALGNNMNPFAYAWTSLYSLGLVGNQKSGGLVTYDLNTSYLRTAARMFGAYMNYSWNPNTHKLILAENPRADQEIILLHSYVDKPDYMILQDRFSGYWCESYSLAEAKEILAGIRGRFGSLPGPNGNIQQNANELKSEAKELKEQLLKELAQGLAGDNIPLMPLHG